VIYFLYGATLAFTWFLALNVTLSLAVAATAQTMYIAEQFTFSGRKLIDVRVHVCDAVSTS